MPKPSHALGTWSTDFGEPLSPEHERRAIAISVQKHHGEDGPRYILNQMGRPRGEGDENGDAMWQEVGRRFEAIWIAPGKVQ